MKNSRYFTLIAQNVWQELQAFRHKLSYENYIVVFFLLTGYRNKIINGKNADSSPITNFLYDGIIETTDLQKLATVITPLLNNLETSDVDKIEVIFENVFKSADISDFKEIFDALLYLYSRSLGKLGGESILPKEISQFLCDIAYIEDGAVVYNPFAGLASFGIFYDKAIHYNGQEINLQTWALGYLRLLAHDKIPPASFKCEDSLTDFQTSPISDLIIADPPFNLKTSTFGISRTAESIVLEQALNALSPTGRLIMLVPNSFLFKVGVDSQLRKKVVEEDVLEMIISLPVGLLYHTSIAVNILIVNMAKPNQNFIKFIDATDSYTINDSNERVLDTKRIKTLINSYAYAEKVRIVTAEKVRDYDYNLSVSRYFVSEVDGVALTSFLKLYSGIRTKTPIQGPVVRVSDLKNSPFDYHLQVDKLSESTSKNSLIEIDRSCILISTLARKLKPTYFKYEGRSIFINHGILSLIVEDDKVVDIEFLINELHSDYVSEQVKALNYGTAISILSRKDFLNIKIKLPSLNEQRAKVEGAKQVYLKNKETELKLEKEVLGLKDESFREYASLRHTLGQYLNALKSNVSGTSKFIANNAGTSITLDSVYSKNLNMTLGVHLSRLEGIVDSMSKILQKFEQDENEGEVREHDVSMLIRDSQNRFLNPDIFKFEDLFIDRESFIMVDEDEAELAPIININEEDFFNIFSNIVSNAVEHGFKKRTNNLIRCTLAFDNETRMCVIEISNNGLPFPDNFSYNDLITRGEKTTDSFGSGIGGSDIKEIMRKYSGIFELESKKDDDFPVKYILKLPLLTINI